MDVLICPSCPTWSDGRIDLRTLERTGDVLGCACGRRYPVVDEVPMVLRDPAVLVGPDIVGVIEAELAPEVAALLVAGESAYARMMEHLSTYLDAHWGDRATPAVDFGMAGLAAKLADLAPVALAVELGCSVGRGVAELARRARHVVGVDYHAGAVRRARRLLAGAEVAYGRRMIGSHYAAARTRAGDLAPAPGTTTLICGDVLEPPLVPGQYDRVVALNLLDSVANPERLLGVIHNLCAPGGEVVIAAPYAWHAGVTPETARFGGADPGGELVRYLGSLGYAIEEEDDVPWVLRRDARNAMTCVTHYVRARRARA
jgi:SAM-dependent methyltransferase/uncharacterized protein YbaR (Trm112 family)